MDPPKTVLITGSSRGIGLAFVELYQKSGWNVIAAARNLASADNLKALHPYRLVQMDTSDEQSILNAADELQDEAVDLLINNAGIMIRDTLANATKDSIMQQFEVNAMGPFLITRSFAPHLSKAAMTNGHAIAAQISSGAGSIARNDEGGRYGYRSSKAALNMINASLAIDLIKDKIISVAIHPGFVGTEINGYAGPMPPEASCEQVSKVIAVITREECGKYLNYDGSILPW